MINSYGTKGLQILHFTFVNLDFRDTKLTVLQPPYLGCLGIKNLKKLSISNIPYILIFERKQTHPLEVPKN